LEECREREKLLSFLARSGTHAPSRAPASAVPDAPLVARAEVVEPDTEAMVVDVAPIAASEPAEADEGESLEFALPAPRGVSRRVFVVAGLAFLVAGGLLAWVLLSGTPPESPVNGSAPSHAIEPRTPEKPAQVIVTPQPTKVAPEPAPTLVEGAPAVSEPKPVEPAPTEGEPKPREPTPTVATPKPTEPTPALIAPVAKPAGVKPSPVVVPKPPTVKATPAATKPRAAAPKPAAAKPSASQKKEKSDYRTPAVW
jgi:hypothetical protein